MKDRAKATRYPGVYRVDDATYWIRAKATDPRTGKKKEAETGVSAQVAAARRTKLLKEIKVPVGPARKVCVGEFARSWIESKALSTSPRKLVSTYAAALRS